jgi:hypothetical protein
MPQALCGECGGREFFLYFGFRAVCCECGAVHRVVRSEGVSAGVHAGVHEEAAGEGAGGGRVVSIKGVAS